MKNRTCRVIKDYESAYPAPLILRAGETISLGDRDDVYPGWIMATDGRGQSGWVPESYIVIDGLGGTLLRDYDATELTVSAGEMLEVVDEESEWVRCVTQDGRMGWVPLENVDFR